MKGSGRNIQTVTPRLPELLVKLQAWCKFHKNTFGERFGIQNVTPRLPELLVKLQAWCKSHKKHIWETVWHPNRHPKTSKPPMLQRKNERFRRSKQANRQCCREKMKGSGRNIKTVTPRLPELLVKL
jgi:hypothetical protein